MCVHFWCGTCVRTGTTKGKKHDWLSSTLDEERTNERMNERDWGGNYGPWTNWKQNHLAGTLSSVHSRVVGYTYTYMYRGRETERMRGRNKSLGFRHVYFITIYFSSANILNGIIQGQKVLCFLSWRAHRDIHTPRINHKMMFEKKSRSFPTGLIIGYIRRTRDGRKAPIHLGLMIRKHWDI